MPNVHLTEPMQKYVQAQIESGAYANLSEVVRAGVRMLMEKDGARQFYALKADLEMAATLAENGDFAEFDYILAMDHSNFNDIEQQNPGESRAQVSLFLDFANNFEEVEVPDPYYGGARGFEYVLDLIEDASAGLLKHIRQRHGL